MRDKIRLVSTAGTGISIRRPRTSGIIRRKWKSVSSTRGCASTCPTKRRRSSKAPVEAPVTKKPACSGLFCCSENCSGWRDGIVLQRSRIILEYLDSTGLGLSAPLFQLSDQALVADVPPLPQRLQPLTEFHDRGELRILCQQCAKPLSRCFV